MTEQFTMDELMDILVVETGLSRDSVTQNPMATFADCDLDSLAFLQLQVVVEDRYGFELDSESQAWTFGEILNLVNDGRSQQVG